jgi:hypothetical protein
MKDIKNLSEQEVRDIVSKFDAQLLELRKAIKAEGDRINAEYAPKLQAGQRVHLESVESYASLSNKFRSTYSARDPYARKLEKFDKINRKNAREAKKNSKEVEQKRIEGLASNLRKLLAPVEKALAESIIENDNALLESQDKKLSGFSNPYHIKSVNLRRLQNENPEYKLQDGEYDYSYSQFVSIEEIYGRFWTRCGTNALPLGGTEYKLTRRDDIEGRIERDAKAYAKAACDSFACKIVVKTEQEIASRKSSEKIVSTNYEGSINPWDGGKVIVKTDKSEYVWNTKVILNFSKYGTPFNQWPTRLQK